MDKLLPGIIMVVLSTGLVMVVGGWFLSFGSLERQRFTNLLPKRIVSGLGLK